MSSFPPKARDAAPLCAAGQSITIEKKKTLNSASNKNRKEKKMKFTRYIIHIHTNKWLANVNAYKIYHHKKQ